MTDPAPAPPPAPAPAPSAATSSIGPGQILALVGSAAVLISSWLTWVKSVGGSDADSAHEGPAKFLIDYNSQPEGLSIGTLLIILAIVGVVGALVAQARILTLIAGAGAIIVAVLFMYQIKSILDDADSDLAPSFGDVVGIGAYIALIGGVLALIGGVVSLRRS
jgi:hypothetical protein